MAMKEKAEQKRVQKQRKIMPDGENDLTDPNMYVEETITMLQHEGQQSETSVEAEQETNQEEQKQLPGMMYIDV